MMEAHVLSPSLVTYEALKVISGYQQAGAIERWAKSQGIKLFFGRAGPWTMIELVNTAAGAIAGSASANPYSGNILGGH